MKIHSPVPARKTRLEIIPLIDVMFFLLASFMMVSLTMTKQQTIPVNLPAVAGASADFQPEMIQIGVNAAGDVFLDRDPVALPDLAPRLRERSGPETSIPVFISGDADTRHADMVRVLDEVRRAGYSRVAFNVRAPST
jgi:biopolymer transport protein ExbD